jgi:hypothetical protein
MFPKLRALKRIGVVATGRVQRHAPPPGLVRLMDHIGAPWSRKLIGCTARISAILGEDKMTQEQCHHTLQAEDGGANAVIQFTLDWQRHYSDAPSLSPGDISKRASTCLEDALKYFETFGAGDLNYAD